MRRHPAIEAFLLMLTVCGAAEAADGDWAATVYGARMASESGWEDVLIDPIGAQYTDTYQLVGALSRRYGEYRDGALALEAEGQVAKHFGGQHHWEFNAVPIVVRWRKFPWSGRVDTSAAFGLGLSYATAVPEVEVELETESEHTLVYWVAELTAGPVASRWAASLRLHHRSVAFGLMGDRGGGNSVGLGLRYRFPD